MEERSTTSARISWDQQTLVDHFEISFERTTGGICPSYHHTHSGLTVDGGSTEFTVSGLEEYSTYSFTVRAVNSAGTSGPTTVRVTTLTAGKDIHWRSRLPLSDFVTILEHMAMLFSVQLQLDLLRMSGTLQLPPLLSLSSGMKFLALNRTVILQATQCSTDKHPVVEVRQSRDEYREGRTTPSLD